MKKIDLHVWNDKNISYSYKSVISYSMSYTFEMIYQTLEKPDENRIKSLEKSL